MRRRLALVAAAVTALVALAFAIPLGIMVQSTTHDRAVSDAERDAAALAPVLGVTRDEQLLTAAIARTSTGAEGRLAIVLPDGSRLGGGAELAPESIAQARRSRQASRHGHGGGVDVVIPVVTTGGHVAVAAAHVSRGDLRDGVVETWLGLGSLVITLVVAAVAIADRLARSITASTSALAGAARRLAAGDLDARAEPSGPAEVAEVARAFNGLARRLRGLLTSERERVADLSHRLRTPLMALRLDAESSGSPDVVADVDRLERAVSELITAARRPLTDAMGACADLDEVAAERTEFWGALAEEQDRHWRFEGPGRLLVEVDPDELAAALDSILGNVFEHTPEGSGYRVEVRRSGEHGLVRVDDDGPGLDGDRMVARGTSGAGGTGLGLDIARRTAEAAGGELVLGSQPGGGTRVELRFPLAAPRGHPPL